MITQCHATALQRGRGSVEAVGIASHCRKLKPSETRYPTISDIALWRDLVELTASDGREGKSERRLSDALARIAPSGAVFISVPDLCREAGIGKTAVRAARQRLADRGLLTFQSEPGRGLLTCIQLLMPRVRHGW